ncbi:PREDICTED: trem-like transcript 2 protein isoform X1 [Bison bison bison]|uniref:Trem-like transcript 2 protein n=1 Tax=Bison bison bison TaxID=43346 RepID=A0A6P3JBN0_BISBB|nr:PREDICTED: trem-like transcript 2 protein isoform X1 [Bison bison bison]
MPPAFLLLLLLLLWLQGPVSGAPMEHVYSKLQHFEGETLSVQCSYKSRKNHLEGKVWCKIRRRKCETGFTRVGVQGPRYLLQDDTQAKVVNITMAALRLQDSGRYWCMRNSSGILYPLMGFLLEVSPASITKGNTPLTKLPSIFQSETVVATGPAPTSGPGSPFISRGTVFTAGLLTLARPLPSPTSRSTRLTSVMGSSFSSTSLSTTGPGRATGSQTATVSPSNTRASAAALGYTSTKAAHLCTVGAPTMGMCPTSRTLLNHLFPSRYLEFYPMVLVGVLALLPMLVMLIVVYSFWKKRHMGSYSVCRDPARSCKDSPARPEPPWRSAWSEATQLWGGEELLPEGPRETPRRLLRGGAKTGTCLGWSRAGGEDCATWTQVFLEPEAVPHLLGSPGLLGTWRGWESEHVALGRKSLRVWGTTEMVLLGATDPRGPS